MRHSTSFGACLALLLVVTLALYLRLGDFEGEDSIDLSKVDDNSVITYVGLLRRQHSSLKLGFIGSGQFTPPRIGLIGNHQVQYFSRSIFGPDVSPDYFFNFFYANMGLTDARDYLLHLEKLNKLPTDVILVQVTTPNNDNGRYILESGGELSLDVTLSTAAMAYNGPIENVVRYFESGVHELRRMFSYDTLLLGIFVSGRQVNIVNTQQCDAMMAQTGTLLSRAFSALNVLPGTVLGAFGALDERVLCRKEYLHNSYRGDGSTLPFKDEVLNLNENSLDHRTAALQAGDEQKIARHMQEIIEIGRRNNRTVVFLIPPIYETPRKSLVDDIFSRALALLPDVPVIDHRHLQLDSKFFVTYDHPANFYYGLVVEELRQRGLLPQPKDASGTRK